MKSSTGTDLRLSPARLGTASGLAATLFYLGCVFLMAIMPRELVIAFSNILLHGFDVRPILQHAVGPGEVLLGMIYTFLLALSFGAIVAAFYNLELKWIPAPNRGDSEEGR